jgi:hypothetical protein
MARQGNHGGRDTRSVNWSDVAMVIEALEQQYGGLVKLQVDREGCRGGSEALWVRALAYEGWSDFGERPVDVSTQLWPSNACRTMAGMCFRGLHSLDHMLDARHREDKGGRAF